METLEEIIDNEDYRDHINTVDESGKRVWVTPRKPKGRLHNYRAIVAVILLTVFFAVPFIKVNGHPFFLMNIFERKFIIFGNVFMPQDFIFFGLAMITLFVFVILFTVVFGRVWCGWACPQTVFMEMVFRKIEYWIEGDANQQRKLNAQPWNAEKIRKKGLKQIIFLAISFLISHTVMAYLIGIDETLKIVSQPPTPQNFAGFLGLLGFTAIFYFVFAYFREQACIAVCPYGRLQGVLLGKDSIVVAYDHVRGEPRGKLKRKKEPEATPNASSELTIDDLVQTQQGDCIDCKLCVQVCPTNIDIRNGTQLECVNCTACIDACDQVMDKIDKPRGLVRFASHENIEKGTKFKFTPRIMAYSAVLLILLVVQAFLLTQRADVEATVLRVPGMIYKELDNGNLMNLYNVQVANKTQEEKEITFKLKAEQAGVLEMIGSDKLKAEPSHTVDGVFKIEIPKEKVKGHKNKIYIEVWSGDELLETVSTNFLGPIN